MARCGAEVRQAVTTEADGMSSAVDVSCFVGCCIMWRVAASQPGHRTRAEHACEASGLVTCATSTNFHGSNSKLKVRLGSHAVARARCAVRRAPKSSRADETKSE